MFIAHLKATEVPKLTQTPIDCWKRSSTTPHPSQHAHTHTHTLVASTSCLFEEIFQPSPSPTHTHTSVSGSLMQTVQKQLTTQPTRCDEGHWPCKLTNKQSLCNENKLSAKTTTTAMHLNPAAASLLASLWRDREICEQHWEINTP